MIHWHYLSVYVYVAIEIVAVADLSIIAAAASRQGEVFISIVLWENESKSANERSAKAGDWVEATL